MGLVGHSSDGGCTGTGGGSSGSGSGGGGEAARPIHDHDDTDTDTTAGGGGGIPGTVREAEPLRAASLPGIGNVSHMQVQHHI
jgi:hypothetical protein